MFLGEELIGPTPSNQRGYSEDRRFLELFELILRYNDTTFLYSGEGSLIYTQAHLELLETLVSQRDGARREWCVKQPRVALFLPMWQKVVPGCHYIFVVRDPRAVINSLLKRESNKFLYQASEHMGRHLRDAYLRDRQAFAAKYARAYVRTNRDILAHLQNAQPESCLVVPFDRLTDLARRVLEWLTDRWKLSLEQVALASIYEENLLTTSDEYLLENCNHLEEAFELQQQLLEHCAVL